MNTKSSKILGPRTFHKLSNEKTVTEKWRKVNIDEEYLAYIKKSNLKGKPIKVTCWKIWSSTNLGNNT